MLRDQWKIHTYSIVKSTMDQAVKHLTSDEYFAVLANHQINGRGRHGHQWISIEGNLYMTLALKPIKEKRLWSQISFIAALATGESIIERLINENPPKLFYKWPNDILIGDKKVSGILLEIIEPSWLLVGIGVNLQGSPKALQYPTTYLNEYTLDVPTSLEMLNSIIKKFSEKIHLWEEEGFDKIKKNWLDSAKHLGQDIEVKHYRKKILEKVRGRFIDLDDDGALLLKGPDDKLKRITAGDVFLI